MTVTLLLFAAGCGGAKVAAQRELIELMSTSIVSELTKPALTALRLAANAPLPPAGWLVRVVFTQVDEGNQLRRAVIGFGAGRPQTNVVVSVHDLAEGVRNRSTSWTSWPTAARRPGPAQ